MLNKSDSIALAIIIIGGCLGNICLMQFNYENDFNKKQFTLSENLNNVYMNGKRWDFKYGLFMLFYGFLIVGLMWILKLDRIYDLIPHRKKV